MHTAKIELGRETCGVLNGMDVIRLSVLKILPGAKAFGISDIQG